MGRMKALYQERLDAAVDDAESHDEGCGCEYCAIRREQQLRALYECNPWWAPRELCEDLDWYVDPIEVDQREQEEVERDAERRSEQVEWDAELAEQYPCGCGHHRSIEEHVHWLLGYPHPDHCVCGLHANNEEHVAELLGFRSVEEYRRG